jgi:hypothetical protein
MNKNILKNNIIIRLLSSIMLLLITCSTLLSQEKPPRPIIVAVTAQGLSFGAFTQGATGGTVTVSATGVRSSSGDVILLGMGYTFTPALFEVTGNPGTLVSLLNGLDVNLPGSNGGSMTLHLDASNPISPFIINAVPPAITQVTVGGTLTVGSPASNPPGIYGGTFNITFIQE